MSIESMMPYSHLILCRPLFLPPSIFPSIRVFKSVSSSHQMAKGLEFIFSINPSNEYSILISFTMDWLLGYPYCWHIIIHSSLWMICFSLSLFFFLVCLAKGLSVLFVLKNKLLVLIFSIVFLISFLFTFSLVFIVSFLLLTLGLIYIFFWFQEL